MAYVRSIAFTPSRTAQRPADRYERTGANAATLLPRYGIAGDVKGSRGGRQLNIMFAETVDDLAADGFRTAPGELGEQLVIAGLQAEGSLVGLRLRLGSDAIIELVELRTGCERFAAIQGQPAARAAGRLGYMARVLSGGEIAVGAEVVVHSE